jgi:hypothetical protein
MAERRLDIAILTGGLLASGVAIARIGLFPAHVPAAPAFNTGLLQELQARGWQSTRINRARRAHDLSQGDGYRFRSQQQPSASISLVPVRVRDAEELNANKLDALLNRDTKDASAPLHLGADAFQLTMGPNNSTNLRGCIASGAVHSGPRGIVATSIAEDWITSLLERLKVFLGLRPPRDLSCLFVKIEARGGRDSRTELKRIWRSTGTVITASRQAETDQKRR